MINFESTGCPPYRGAVMCFEYDPILNAMRGIYDHDGRLRSTNWHKSEEEVRAAVAEAMAAP
jgi:hypothetical protein